ncbi:hypothetical protein LQ327_02415 [Actinomycetospora endophytica]|uniref:Fibronectin type-III domain-containing protein n=1 Tax=Actinomycetospora endophytica TaxID=2291215 RepID=A0ABS8P5B6_9PSEU|nr:hypothetical protein [Actinomycetospora endophytica]MCD2192249.1 hypothetical protein [Actinomycetospora endophytica]
MRGRLPLVALIATVALLAGGGVALAAWSSSGPGSVTARAGSLGTPTASATAWVCTGLLGTSTSKFTNGGAVEALPRAAALPQATTSTATPLASSSTTTSPAAPTTSSSSPVTTATTPAPTTATAAAPMTSTTIATPTSTTTGGATGVGSLASTLSWTAVTSATSYQFQASTTTDFAAPVTSGTTSVLSNNVTVRALVKTSVYLRVRAAAGAWTGAWSPVLTTSAGPCLL